MTNEKILKLVFKKGQYDKAREEIMGCSKENDSVESCSQKDKEEHSNDSEKKEKLHRFNEKEDLKLLQLVNSRKPHLAAHGTKIRIWDEIAKEIHPSLDSWSSSKRVKSLTKAYRKKCNESLAKSGVIETFTDKEHELALILQDEDYKAEEAKKKKLKHEMEIVAKDVSGEEIRKTALQTLQEKKLQVPKKEKEKKMTIEDSIAKFVSNQEKDFEIRMLELKNEKRRQKIELKQLKLKLRKDQKKKGNNSKK